MINLQIRLQGRNMANKQIKFKNCDVFKIYQAAYNIEVPWNDILPSSTSNFLELFEKATSCPRNLTMASCLSLTSCLCGPKSSIEGFYSNMKTSLNMYLIAVCDPGGGK